MKTELKVYGKVKSKKEVPLLFLCEHALPYVPSHYGTLGIPKDALFSHYGWDIGALELFFLLLDQIKGHGVYSKISRLVIDFNRVLTCPDLIRTELDPGEPIPGNRDLSREEIKQRIRNFWFPFHREVRKTIQEMKQKNLTPFLISIHSFTPEWRGEKREMDIGLLFHSEFSKSKEVCYVLKDKLESKGYLVSLNRPYSVEENPDPYPLHHWAKEFGLSYLAFEVNNRLLRSSSSIRKVGWDMGQAIEETF